ncbi:cystathionine beta-lyase [Granulicella aggregans]|uniref:Cystathionine beta-lyase n=1 Tax=Granulicella aggregans TaxID=474949 RepID=A0A7W7ZET6_9BACT|nr:cystathionine beta-lyase [Granulicella aggregans]MBB5058304.1 cystathionine beta-lyase [Granulicella aggregans]
MHWKSRILHSTPTVPTGFNSFATPVYRGSTILLGSMANAHDEWHMERGWNYGLYGTPTALELGARIAAMEGARHTFLAPGGQAAISLIYLSFCKSGSHALVPFNAYGPNRHLAGDLLRGLGIEVEAYDPMIGSEIASLVRPNTSLIWCESPGSVTMEIQDVTAIVVAAHERGVTVALDNTYAAGVLLDAFAMGVDVSMQALTKYIGGHSDLLLGSVSVNTEAAYRAVGSTHQQIGMAVSPDDCSLALRGLQTLAVRLEKLEASTLEIARWCAEQAEIETVLHPAMESCPGHEFWKRDFTGSSSIFSMVFDRRYSPEQVNRFVDSLKMFGIGWSWGGTHSLAMAYPGLERPTGDYAGRIVRLNVGLEEPVDLIEDLRAAMVLALV